MFEQEDLLLTPKERANALILTVEPDRAERQNIRTALKQLGFGGITDCPTHAAALDKIQERRVTHIVFDAKKTNMPTKEFVSKVLEFDPSLILIPASFEPNVDDVFDLLVLGARGYLVKPFTVETVDAALVTATKGEPIADSVRQAKDRNEALVAVMMASLDKLATVLRQAKHFDTARREIPGAIRGFRVSAELARTFAKEGQKGLFETLERFCLDRSNGPATRLGRLRKRLQTKPAKQERSSTPVA